MTPEQLNNLLLRFIQHLRDKRWVVERTINAERETLEQVIREYLNAPITTINFPEENE